MSTRHRSDKKDDCIPKQEGHPQNQQRARAEEQYLIAELTDEGAKIVRPQGLWREYACHCSENEQGDRVIDPGRIPGLWISGKPGRQGPRRCPGYRGNRQSDPYLIHTPEVKVTAARLTLVYVPNVAP